MSALTARLELSSSARVVLATLLVAAGAIHLAMVPSHASASTSEGLTFAAVGSVQLLLGVVVAQRASWLVLGAAAIVSLASIGAWVVSRTTGLPYGAHEGVAEAATTVDVTTVVLEFLAVVVVAVLAFAPTMGDTWSRGAVALTSTIPVLVLVFAANALASPGALDHGNSERVAAASGDVHDHGIDSAAAPAVTPVAAAPEPPLDESGQRTLDQQLDTVRALIARYPTVASAKAAGMYDATSPAHGPPWYFVAPANQRFASDPGFDLEHPLVFLYAGRSDVSPVVGVAYYEFAERGPRGFAGPDDTWAVQRGLCSVANRGGGSQIV
jgi:hypothetical protein